MYEIVKNKLKTKEELLDNQNVPYLQLFLKAFHKLCAPTPSCGCTRENPSPRVCPEGGQQPTVHVPPSQCFGLTPCHVEWLSV